ncbi:MAG: signal transduction histidine kinase [Rhodomicrobium sp.]
MTNSSEIQIECPGDSASLEENEFSPVQSPIFQLEVDENPRNSEGLILRGWDGATPLRVFISSRVMDNWAGPRRTAKNGKCLFREDYNELSKRNLAAIERIVVRKYRRGLAFNRQHPFVDVLLSDVVESGEVLDVGETREPPLPQ